MVFGEYGYLSPTGYYLTTVYATDEQGKFKILDQKKELYQDYLARLARAQEPSAAALERDGRTGNDEGEEGYYFEYTARNNNPGKNLHHHEVGSLVACS